MDWIIFQRVFLRVKEKKGYRCFSIICKHYWNSCRVTNLGSTLKASLNCDVTFQEYFFIKEPRFHILGSCQRGKRDSIWCAASYNQNVCILMTFNLLFHSTPTVQFQEMLFPKTERKGESGVSMKVNAMFLLVQSFQSLFWLLYLLRNSFL